MEKVLLSTYLLKILDNKGNEQVLSKFNSSNDFIEVLDRFLENVLKLPIKVPNSSRSANIYMSLENKPKFKKKKREVHGVFSSGVGGESYLIKNIATLDTVHPVTPNEAAFRNSFFYIEMPKNKLEWPLVLQRNSKFGIKTALTKSINSFLKSEGYSQYKVRLDNVMHGKVFDQMMKKGAMRKIEFYKYGLPNSRDQALDFGVTKGSKGKLYLGLSSSSAAGLLGWPKILAERLFKSSSKNKRVVIPGTTDELDEVSFTLNLNGKDKTFYVRNKNRIQPDVDVTSKIILDAKGIPKTSSLLSEAKSLVVDLIKITSVSKN